MDCTKATNPLKREGTSKKQRLPAALHPDFIKVDERQIEDLLDFAMKYAREVRYFNFEGEVEGDWTEFFEHDISTLLSLIIKTEPGEDEEAFILLRNKILLELGEDWNETFAEADFNALMEIIFSMFFRIDKWLRGAISEHGIRNEFLKALNPGLRQGLQRSLIEFIALEKGAEAELGFYRPHNYSFLSEDWQLDPATIIAIPANTLAFARIPLMSTGEKVGFFLLPKTGFPGELVKPEDSQIQAVFDSLFEQTVRLAARAPALLEKTIEEYPQHQPHIALFIAFLLIFEVVQNEINTLTKKHLDFYYRDVLRLQEKKAIPDKVHVLFELAKKVEQHKIARGTLLSAGKDATGVDILFAVDPEIVVNQASVAQLKTLFINKRPASTTSNADDVQNIFAAPKANSGDGVESEIERVPASWKTFGEDQSTFRTNERSMPDADLGIAIASPALVLNEGTRTVFIKLDLDLSEAEFFNNFLVPFLADTDQGVSWNTLEDILGKALIVEFSGAEAWLQSSKLTVFIGRRDESGTIAVTNSGGGLISMNTYLLIKAVLDADIPPVTYYDKEVLGETYQTKWPVVKVRLRSGTHGYVYQHLRTLKLKRIETYIQVEDLTNLQLQSDQGKLNPSKPFSPFGTSPVAGSGFYMGNAEVFSKQLTDLKINIQWLDAPENFADYYQYYLDSNSKKVIAGNQSFTAQMQMLYDFAWRDISFKAPSGQACPVMDVSNSAKNLVMNSATDLPVSHPGSSPDPGPANRLPLFAKTNAMNPVTLQPVPRENHSFWNESLPTAFKTPASGGASIVNGLGFKRDVDLREIGPFQPNTKRGFIKLELNCPEFQHKAYTSFLTMTLIVGSDTAKELHSMPQEPWSPNIKSLSLDYKTEFILDFADKDDPNFFHNNEVEQIFHIYPFGQALLQPVTDPAQIDDEFQPALGSIRTNRLFPQFKYSPNLNAGLLEGALFIGIQDLDTPRSLSLFFQFAEGTGDIDFTVPQVTWCYLSHNEWVKFQPNEILNDTTLGMVKSGTITFTLPREASTEHTRLPAGLHWIRATVPHKSVAIPSLIDIQAQAGIAVFQDQGNDPNRLESPLSADSVKGLDTSQSQVKKIRQPYSSFGGKTAEASLQFYRRISERLRHKNRAINIWDYERLVLENFPSVFKVICLNHTTRYAEIAPGHVLVVLIPDLQNVNTVNIREPRVSVGTLTEVQAFLSKKKSPFATLEVVNPLYEQVQAEFQVTFYPDKDPGFYQQELEKDLIRFLSPWAYDTGAEIAFGGKVSKSVIIDFIDERNYVDYVKDFKLYSIVEGKKLAQEDEVTATTSRSILVSAAKHLINKEATS